MEKIIKLIVQRSRNRAYGALMEVILNSIQACRNRILANENTYCPEIRVVFDRKNNQVNIIDNGIGISDEFIQKAFMCIGNSYHSYEHTKSTIAGRNVRGMGFIEVFNISDVVEVTTHNLYEAKGKKLLYDLSKDTVSVVEADLGDRKGTAVSFDYNSFVKYVGNESEVEKILNRIGGFAGNIQMCVQSINTKIIGVDSPSNDTDDLKHAIDSMQDSGDIKEFIEQLKIYNGRLSNRDLMTLDEKHFKFQLLIIFNLYSKYTVISEQEVDSGYIDILLRKHLSHHVNYEWIIELKYVKKSARNNLQKVRNEGLKQVSSYARSRAITELIETDRLRCAVITFLGKDDVFFDYVSMNES